MFQIIEEAVENAQLNVGDQQDLIKSGLLNVVNRIRNDIEQRFPEAGPISKNVIGLEKYVTTDATISGF